MKIPLALLFGLVAVLLAVNSAAGQSYPPMRAEIEVVRCHREWNTSTRRYDGKLIAPNYVYIEVKCLGHLFIHDSREIAVERCFGEENDEKLVDKLPCRCYNDSNWAPITKWYPTCGDDRNSRCDLATPAARRWDGFILFFKQKLENYGPRHDEANIKQWIMEDHFLDLEAEKVYPVVFFRLVDKQLDKTITERPAGIWSVNRTFFNYCKDGKDLSGSTTGTTPDGKDLSGSITGTTPVSNECSTAPCRNGGTCTNCPGSYSCRCQSGWTGNNCNQDINECNRGACKNGGTCTNSQGGYSCICPDEWKGNNCNQEVNACDIKLSLVKVGSSKQFGCYKGENGPQCWHTHAYEWSPSVFGSNKYHDWCNIPNEMCTLSLHKSANCTSENEYTYDYDGSICVNQLTNHYCDFRTGKRYGCHNFACWRTCDEKTDEYCNSEGWCYADAGRCSVGWRCLLSTTMPCTDSTRLIVKT